MVEWQIKFENGENFMKDIRNLFSHDIPIIMLHILLECHTIHDVNLSKNQLLFRSRDGIQDSTQYDSKKRAIHSLSRRKFAFHLLDSNSVNTRISCDN